MASKCVICSTLTKNKCSHCNQAFYCSVQHQKQDWKSHKINCHPFRIEENEILGRYLIAARCIQPFEILLREAPIIRGPTQITRPVCLGCLNGIQQADYINCNECGWPLCGEECNAKLEHQLECELTVKSGRKVNIQEFTNPHPLYQCISTVRCLLLKNKNKSKWEQFIKLESLENTRRGSPQWKADLESIGKFIPKFFNTNDYTEDEIMKVIGTIQINGHEVPSSDPPHVAIFQYASLFEHSCLPNVAKSFTKNGHIVLWAPKKIKKNSNLSICYSDALWGTVDRQTHLMHTKLFKCTCQRCLDITEHGTNYSALKCINKSCNGVLLPLNSNAWHDKWRCEICLETVGRLYISNILERARIDLHAMENTVENCIKFIDHYKQWFPNNHFYISDVKIQLVQLIGKEPKDLMIIPEEHLQIKIEYSRELLENFEIIAPCEVRILGILYFVLHSAIAEKTRRISLNTSVSPKLLLEESLLFVEKAVDYLQYESDIFAEGLILKQAKINRDTLKMVMRM